MATDDAAVAPIRVLVADHHERARDDLWVVVLDLSLPDNDLDALRRLKEGQPDVAVVILSRHREPDYVREVFAAGADGYVLKQSPSAVLLDTVQAASRGERRVDPALALEPVAGAAAPPLSAREREVLRGAASGESNKSIAQRLRISVKTVDAHKANAMYKLGLKDRRELVRFALNAGWFSED